MQLKVLATTVGKGIVKASPYILFGMGTISLGGSLFSMFKATTALEPILDEHNKDREQLDLELEDDLGYLETEDAKQNAEKNHKKKIFYDYKLKPLQC